MTTKEESVRVFISLFGAGAASKLPQDSPVDFSSFLSQFVGKPYGEIKDSKQVERLRRVLDLTDRLIFPDVLAPLNGLKGEDIRRLVQLELNRPRLKRPTGTKTGLLFVATVLAWCLAFAIGVYTRPRLFPCPIVTCPLPKCPTCTKCASCPPPQSCPPQQCPAQPPPPPRCDFDFSGAKHGSKHAKKVRAPEGLELCIKILIAREQGRPQDFMEMNVTRASKQELKKKVRKISLLIHPDKISKGLQTICAEALAYTNEFGR